MDEDQLGNADLAVEVSDDGYEVRATITRPDERNALNDAVLGGLEEVLEFADEGDPRVVVVSGEGSAFCAGGDIKSMAGAIGQGAQAYREGFEGLKHLVEKLVDTGAITVAAVDGYCLAGGMGLAAACDLIVATDESTFGTPEADIGLFPAQALTPIMRTVNEKQGLRMLFTGEKFGAERAEEMGLVTELVPPEEFEESVDDLVDDLVNSSPAMIEIGKEAYYNQRDMGFEEALSYMREIITLVAMTDDAEEGINSFLMNEEPDWKVREDES